VTTDNGSYEARTLVIASGMAHRKLGVPGEDRLRGKGVAYCATCDAPLFAGMDVAVVGGGNSAIDAVLQLLKIANKIYVIDRSPAFKADPILVERIMESGKVTAFHNAAITEIRGDRFVNGIAVDHAGEQKELRVEGVLVEIGWTPASGFAGTVEKNRHGEIIVDCGSKTNVPGIFAAGDVTSVPAKQIIVACGEGAKAALAAFRYVNEEVIDEVTPVKRQ
jgi:alkyl hydroperoxide reductase subunit AhpF